MKEFDLKSRIINRSIDAIFSDGREQLWFDEGCSMCGSFEKLVMDHCHTTGLFRGYLCQACNTREGQNRSFVWVAWRALAPSLDTPHRMMYPTSLNWNLHPAPDYLNETPMVDLLNLPELLGFKA